MFLLGQAVGKYQILSNLGSGGFGTVFLAKDAWIEKKVAIKVPHRQSGDFDDLLLEPRLLAALDHPNIVGILTAERVDGVFFIVMEYVKGESLEAVLDREKSLDVPRAVNYIFQILKGVEHAHENQVLHRDLRPANVLVSESGLVKVADFGTSRFLEKTHATTVIGSPPYMAPEQFQGRAVLASDIYSVGVILYQMLTGTLPYFSPNPAQIEKLVAQGRCTPPRVRNSCSTISRPRERSTTTPRRWTTSASASRPARSRRKGSAGTAGNRCTRGRPCAPSAARPSNRLR
jgi:serine/threonine-protein kinase